MHKAEGEISREKAPAHDNNVGTALPISSWQDKGSLPWVPCIWEEVARKEDERHSHPLPPALLCPEMAKLCL